MIHGKETQTGDMLKRGFHAVNLPASFARPTPVVLPGCSSLLYVTINMLVTKG